MYVLPKIGFSAVLKIECSPHRTIYPFPFTFICSFFHSFGISYWWLYIHRRYLGFSVSLIFWMSHWVLWSFWINNSPWYRVSSSRSHICSLTFNYNIIYCCVFKVLKTDQGWQGISSTCNQISEWWGIVLSISSMNFRRRMFKNLRWHIGYYILWTRHYLSVIST